MKYETQITTVLVADGDDRPSVLWRAELWRNGEFISGVTHGDLGKAFREAYLVALQECAEDGRL